MHGSGACADRTLAIDYPLAASVAVPSVQQTKEGSAMTRLSLVLRNGLLLLVLGLMATQLGCPSAEPKKTAKPAGEAKPQPAAPSTEQPPSKPGAQPADAPPATKPAEAAASVTPKPPLGLPPVPVPADNPITAAKVELGKMLYFDKRLSKDGTVSCATCHDAENGLGGT